MNPVSKDILMHYGVQRRSGRYPWGSGDNPYQRTGDLLSRIEELKKQGKSELEIAQALSLTTTQLRIQKALANRERRSLEIARIRSLESDGYNRSEIARMMGYNSESSIRSLLNEQAEARMNKSEKMAEFLKKQIAEKGMIDVGVGVERELNISRAKLEEALYILELEGYPVYGGGISQVTNAGKQSNMKVICPPGTEHKEIYEFDRIKTINDYISHDGGETFEPKFAYPKSMNSDRLMVRYNEEGGAQKDGLIELRRNVEDLSLGDSRYAQVRILVDGDKFLKGMAVYSDDMPEGVDIVFNTNKKLGTEKAEVLKSITKDPDNPFGSLIKEEGGQSYYNDAAGVKQMSLINKTREEGDWSEWKDKLPSQFLAKQNLSLINKQLNLAKADKVSEFDEIRALNNPTLKKVLLNSFANDCDSAAVHLYAAALPRQKHKVIMPIDSMKDNEVYAPSFNNGEQLALIRYPHGGTFEIPIVTVNNKQADGKRLLGNAEDAVGINHKVAERLSGADFDGDTVMVIPVGGKVQIMTQPRLKELIGFDHKLEYPYKEGMRVMTKAGTQAEMGKISNLITDMTLKGANPSELARAVRHSMVVIDAEKHKLDYKQSELDNGIKSLRDLYMGHTTETGKYSTAASTLISRAKAEVSVVKRQGSPKINQEGKDWYDPSKPEGSLIYRTADNPTYVTKTGAVKTRLQPSTQMAETNNAFSLVSEANTSIERAYADYANQMKALANQARKEALTTGKITYSKTVNETYKTEVKDLEAKLNGALANAPREREAQRMANTAITAKKQDNPGLTKGELGKIKQQELTRARNTVGASRETIDITDREWEAIQAGAISENQLFKILNNVDIDVLRQRATPRTTTSLSDAKINKIISMNASGYSLAEIAKVLSVSTSVVAGYLREKE